MSYRPWPRLLAGSLLTCVLLSSGLALTACGGTPAPKVGHVAPPRTPDQTYTVRAIITQLPDPNKKQSDLRAKHEAIDDFRDKDGKIVGMGAMDMEFPPHELLDLTGFAIGDKVSITFSVWWGNSPGWLAMKMTKLPAETELTFRAARPPTQTPKPDAKPDAKSEAPATPAPSPAPTPAPAPTPSPAPTPAPAAKP